MMPSRKKNFFIDVISTLIRYLHPVVGYPNNLKSNLVNCHSCRHVIFNFFELSILNFRLRIVAEPSSGQVPFESS